MLQRHASVSHPNLQPIDLETAGDAWLVYSPIADGKPCAVDGSPRASSTVCHWGALWAEALGRLHDAGLVHGQPSIHRLWSDADRSPDDSSVPMLLRDPSGASTASERWLDEQTVPEHQPPELASRTSPTPASDFYSLGRMLFQLLEGRSSWEEAEVDENGLPSKIGEAVGEGAAGDPLLRVIGFAMATDPSQRIADAQTFAKALRAAQQSYEGTEKPNDDKASMASNAESETSTARPNASTTKSTSVPEPKDVAKPSAEPKSKVPAPTPQPPTHQTPAPEPLPPQRTVVRRSRKRSFVGPIILAAMGLVVLGQLVYLAVADPGPRVVMRERERPPFPDRIPSVRSSSARAPSARTPSERRPSVDPSQGTGPGDQTGTGDTATLSADASEGSRNSTVPKFEIVDDARLLFAPPAPTDADEAASPPIVSLMPPGPSILVSLRPQAWFDATKSDVVVSAMQQEWGPWIESFADFSGVTVDQIDRLAVGFYPGRGGFPQVAYSLRLREPVEIETLNSNWEANEQNPVGSSKIRAFRTDNFSYLAWVGDDPPTTQNLFIGNETQSDELLESMGIDQESSAEQDVALDTEPGMAITMRRLWRDLRGDADLCVVLQPNFLFADGRSILENSVPAFEPSLRRILVPDVAAAAWSVHSNDQTYFWESRMLPAGRMTEAALLRRLETEFRKWPSLAESFLADLSLDQSWAGLVKRLPVMVEFAVGQTRFGISDSAVTINQYLPQQAAAQIGVAGLLAANAPSAAVGLVASVEMSTDEILAQPITLAFNQESLKAAMAAVQDEMAKSLPKGVPAPEIILMGGDLQKNGITQNQQIRNFDLAAAPLRQVLTELVRQANSDKTATSSHDPKQMLVWIVDSSGELPVIRITTRDASVDRYDLPDEFQPQS